MAWWVIWGLWFGVVCNGVAAVSAFSRAVLQQENPAWALLKTITQTLVAGCGAYAATYLGS